MLLLLLNLLVCYILNFTVLFQNFKLIQSNVMAIALGIINQSILYSVFQANTPVW